MFLFVWLTTYCPRVFVIQITRKRNDSIATYFVRFGWVSGYVASDDHQPSSVVVDYECTLNDGASAEDLADFGELDFKKFVNKNKLVLNSYLWDAVAVSPPFDEPDVRWNNFPSWRTTTRCENL